MNHQEMIENHLNTLLTEGVTVIPNLFSDGFIDDLKTKVKIFIDKNEKIFLKHRDADGHYPRVINMHLAMPELLNVFTDNPVALGVQDAFFFGESSVYTTLYYERGSAQPIHRDTPYFCTRPEYRYLGVWVALEDSTSENGCLEVIRRGHLVPELKREEMALKHYATLDEVPSSSTTLWDAYQTTVLQTCLEQGLTVEKVEVKAGETVIWHPQLPHGGSAINNILKSRHSLVLHVTPVGTPVYHQDVFFNPKKVVSDKCKWDYVKYKDRSYAHHFFVDFGHTDPHPPSSFVL
jgi:ectoine hydroxylase-related dioxygenase (phytanoyl-CoA dioxygenase family)